MSTLVSALEVIARRQLNELSDSFWSSDELVAILNLGAHDLWRGINDLRLAHFTTLDTTNVSLAASSTTLTGVPADCVRVHMLEPRDLSSTSGSRSLIFKPKPYNDVVFQSARSSDAIDPTSGGTIFWDQYGAGGPVGAPTIVVAPTVSAAVNLALTYVPVLGDLTAASSNPIPGESDNALVAWTVAYARAKEREDRAPDPGWMSIYATEKQNILVSLAPRQDQEPMVADAFFEGYWA